MKKLILILMFLTFSVANFAQSKYTGVKVDALSAINIALKKYTPEEGEFYTGINSQIKLGSEIKAGRRGSFAKEIRNDGFYWYVDISVQRSGVVGSYGYVAKIDAETGEVID